MGAAFVITTIFCCVALMNISIGMFTTYFDAYLERNVELFLRTRADVCVAHILRRDGLCSKLCRKRSSVKCLSSGAVWFCYADVGEGNFKADPSLSIRAQINDLAMHVMDNQRRIDAKLTEVRDELNSAVLNLKDAVLNPTLN